MAPQLTLEEVQSEPGQVVFAILLLLKCAVDTGLTMPGHPTVSAEAQMPRSGQCTFIKPYPQNPEEF